MILLLILLSALSLSSLYSSSETKQKVAECTALVPYVAYHNMGWITEQQAHYAILCALRLRSEFPGKTGTAEILGTREFFRALYGTIDLKQLEAQARGDFVPMQWDIHFLR